MCCIGSLKAGDFLALENGLQVKIYAPCACVIKSTQVKMSYLISVLSILINSTLKEIPNVAVVNYNSNKLTSSHNKISPGTEVARQLKKYLCFISLFHHGPAV